MRCFRCGGQGHMSFSCPNAERQRPCYLCGQFGHSRGQCPNSEPLFRTHRESKKNAAMTLMSALALSSGLGIFSTCFDWDSCIYHSAAVRPVACQPLLTVIARTSGF